MGSRSTYVRRIEQLESAVIAFGRGVATRLPGACAAHHRAIELAVDALTGSPLAQAADVRLVRAERPLLRDGAAAVPDGRLRRVALHVLAVAETARAVVPATPIRPAAPVG